MNILKKILVFILYLIRARQKLFVYFIFYNFFLYFLGQFTVCTANEDATPCPQDNRIIFEKFTSASRVKGTVFTETNACMATILYSKAGDNGTWIMFEQAYGFGAWVSLCMHNADQNI